MISAEQYHRNHPHRAFPGHGTRMGHGGNATGQKETKRLSQPVAA